MKALLEALECPESQLMRGAVAGLASLALPQPALALCAVAWQRWASGDPASRRSHRFQLFQVNRLGWRTADDWTAADDIQAELAEVLRAQLPTQWEGLVAAAAIFNGIFPVEVYIGNGDTGGYTLDCQRLWQDFAPYREWFAEALPLSEGLRREWITLAQVYWSHFRWQADDWFYGTFSEPACDYLLAHAVTLQSPYPIQYYYFYRQLPVYGEAEPAGTGQELALQSGLGLTYFYYAQYCQYHRQDYATALTYYQRFLAAEPACLPDNRFYLFERDATARSYPPSTQEARTEMGNCYLQQGQLPAARAAFEQAIALRPDNFQAPYERIAHLLRAQGEPAAALPWLARKAEACTQTVVHHYGSRMMGIGSYFHYDPANPGPQKLDTYPNAWGWYDPAARVRVLEVNELYKELADAYFYELAEYPPAGIYYKRYLTFLSQQNPNDPVVRARTIDASESQLRLAMEQGDYWQARGLGEKLLRLVPGSQVAQLYLTRIRQRFA
ncbi:tetratricopeptide repeat protein [Hymenobacter negativus]|uniref:tetratricopeptide repeat protein n=1 Tax=Hymenobacter negativus TaxID=2795026 RepID=UPI001AAF8949|nr:tetratricopeptide repeat protein [Hymenobacter negativus]